MLIDLLKGFRIMVKEFGYFLIKMIATILVILCFMVFTFFQLTAVLINKKDVPSKP